jgi:CRP-like cAMP-binding protein
LRPPHPLSAWLERLIEPTAAEYAAIASVPAEIRSFPAEHPLRRGGEAPERAILVLEGLLCATRPAVEDKRQIVALHIPGDWPDLEALHLGTLGCDIESLTACRLACLDLAGLHALCAAHPRLAALLWRTTLVAASVSREWVVNTGHRPAVAALAHLFCEILVRLEAAGLARGRACDLPLTQVHLSRATGLSLVHVNRSLQDLRRRGLVSFGNGRLAVHDWAALAALGQFREDYLHLPLPRWRAA